MPDRDQYLRDLDSLLPMPPERRAEILEEIAGHLDDAVAARVERGADGRRAEAEAQSSLGSPVDLARDLARPEQSAMRLLAAAGAGVRAGIGHGLYGYLLGALSIFLLAMAITVTVQLVGVLLGTGWRLQFTDQGWNSLLLAATIAIALYFAGRGAVRAVSLAARRLEADVRPWVTAGLTVVAAWALWFVMSSPQNLASVIGFALAPGTVALGAYRPRLLPSRVRLSYAVIAVLGMLAIILSIGGATSGIDAESEPGRGPGLPDRGLSHVAPVWETDVDGPGIVTSYGWGSSGDAINWEAEIHAPASLARFSDLRLEAWRADAETFDIDPSHSAPFAVAPVEMRDGALRAEIVTTRDPDGGFWDLVLTGVGPDGVRYVLEAGSGGQSTFEGTAFEWIAAVVD